ncbi:ExeM/NucH family extracellular endonuclease [Microbacterium sp. PRF11]|uniref:ExeM/NucH family extracellular endonuclease n=1 Tax=Microbacterium sp. PRF11 TaxID=2962593 RepID=UPI0028829333|nr:ExeM/NucH family extracellular endonuclease [Microbacterium sp. PRF11]MDT0117347.1 ExeM/NucH family extracellular endonuclease [Microbacterium sp. PRF11]
MPARRFTTALSAALGVALLGSALVPLPASAAVGSKVVINEAYLKGGSNNAFFNQKFVELYNAGDAAQDLSGWSLQYRAEKNVGNGNVQKLTGSIAAGGYYLIALPGNGTTGADLPSADLTSTNITPSGTTGQLLLANVGEPVAPAAGDVADSRVVDFLGYGSAVSFETAPATVTGGNTTPNALVRTDFVDSNDNSKDFTTTTTVTPQGSGTTTPAPDPSGSPSATPTTSPTQAPPVTPGSVVPIREIQGTGATTPLAGQTVTTRGVVTAAYPSGGYNGFYIQTPGTGGEIDTAAHRASDAIFVYGSAATAKVAVGQHVEVTGTATEFSGQTQITADAAGVSVLTEQAAAVLPAKISWPKTDEERERFEGMLLAPQGDFTVTNSYSTNQYAEVGLAAGTTPLRTPTDVARPDTPEYVAAVADNKARGVVLDDGASINFLSDANKGTALPYVSLTDPVRVGAPVTFTRPVILDYRNNAWKFQPTQQLTVANAQDVQPATFANTRTASPAPVGGDLKISSFNVLNYFTTTAASVGCTSVYRDREGNPITADTCPAPGPRGAADDANLKRQQDKIVAAINGLGADVVSLEEIENSAKFGKNRDAALSTLVGALNAALGSEQWAFVPSPAALPASEDVIRTAFIYKKAVAAPVGESVILDDPAFRNARQPLAQTFAPVNAPDAKILAIVNHFKSKGDSRPAATGDNANGIQGAFNGDRVRQAEALGAFAQSRSAAVGTDDVFLLGDFNSYAQEDPIEKLRSFGFEPLEAGTGKYSYSFSGQSGSLDHVLASPSARELVTGTDIWNINAVEALALEYSRFNYNVLNFYDTTPYRSSDHDPVIVGLDLVEDTTKVNLVGINDFHGRIDANTVRFAGTVEQLRAEYGDDNSLFISNGDNIGASVFASSYFGDEPTIDVLNALDLAASAAGNHEFDKGATDLTDRVSDRADFPYLAANVFKDGEPLLPEYAIFEVDGVRVGVVGAITESTPTLVTPSGIQGIEFREPVAEVNRVVAEIDDQVDVIVAQYHEGSGAGEKTTTLEQAVAAGGPFAKIVNETSPSVDAIFTGHTHQLYAWDAPIPGGEGTRPIVQTGNYGENVGQIVLDVDSAGDVVDYTARNVARLAGKDAEANTALDASLIATYPRVKEVDGIVKAARAEADVVGREPVGSVSADITTAFSGGSYVDGVYTGGTRGDRTKQSALGGLVADALLDSLDDADRGGAEVSFVNPGGLRDELLYGADGVITLAEANAVLPFLNNLWTTTLTGDQLRQVLEQQWGDFSKRKDAANLSLGVSENLRYTYDASLPAGQRITGVWIDGVAVDPAKGYRVGSFNFLLGGGDSFSVFAQGTDTRDSGLIDRDAWIAYLEENPGLAPDFTARGVQVSGSTQPVAPGADVTVTVSKLDLTSLGAPANTTLDASFGAAAAATPVSALAAPSTRVSALAAPSAATVAVVDGAATVTVGVPADATGTLQLRLTAQPSGTAVIVPVRVAAAGDGVGTPGDGQGQGQGQGDGQGQAGQGQQGQGAGSGALATTGADTAWMGAGVLAALALLGLGLVARRRSTRQVD